MPRVGVMKGSDALLTTPFTCASHQLCKIYAIIMTIFIHTFHVHIFFIFSCYTKKVIYEMRGEIMDGNQDKDRRSGNQFIGYWRL
mgnify:CR=1 FL=1